MKTKISHIMITVLLTIALSTLILTEKRSEQPPHHIDTFTVINNNSEPIVVEELNEYGMPTGNGLRQYAKGDTLVTAKCKPDGTWKAPKGWLPYGDYTYEIKFIRGTPYKSEWLALINIDPTNNPKSQKGDPPNE